MRKRYVILGGFCIFLIVAVILRWPRLDPKMVSVTRCEVRNNQMVVEYRMAQPFEVALGHGVRKPIMWPDTPGIHLGSWTPLRREKAAFVSSTYDLLRGEYYVYLSFLRGSSLTVDANGRRLEFAAWSAPDAKDAKWFPPGERVRIGDGVGKDILHFAESSDSEEYLILYAGTDVRRSVE